MLNVLKCRFNYNNLFKNYCSRYNIDVITNQKSQVEISILFVFNNFILIPMKRNNVILVFVSTY